ncbi:MAG: hypothetical protein RL211_786 [Pseudomonadota bacterium]|jgi:hypothetical protein
MNADMNTAMPAKTLALMTATVVLAHVVVLQETTVALSLDEPAITRPFITRAIQLAPAVMTTAQEPAPATAEAATAVAVTRKLSTTRRNAPESLPNTPVAPVEYAQVATKTVAPEAPQPPETVAEVALAPSAPAPAEPATPEPALAPKTFVMPGSTRLKYNATGGKDGLTYHASGELLWLHDGKTYDARLEVSAFLIGSRVRTSAGRVTAQGLAPTRFSDKSRVELAAHFDHDKGRVTFSNGPEAPLLTGAQDQLSLFIQLGALLAGEPGKYPVGTTISTQTVGPRAAETWVVAVEREEKLALPGSELATVKLVRNPRREYDQKAELWLAPSMGYLPVRMRITQPNGDFLDLKWRATEPP